MNFLDPHYDSGSLGNLWPGQKSPCPQRPELSWEPAARLNTPTELADTPSLALGVNYDGGFDDRIVEARVFLDLTDSTLAGMDVAVRTPLEIPAPTRLDLAALHIALETNLSYALERIKAAPTNMLLENQTPWCHPLLYKETMPRVIQGKDCQHSSLLLRFTHPEE